MTDMSTGQKHLLERDRLGAGSALIEVGWNSAGDHEAGATTAGLADRNDAPVPAQGVKGFFAHLWPRTGTAAPSAPPEINAFGILAKLGIADDDGDVLYYHNVRGRKGKLRLEESSDANAGSGRAVFSIDLSLLPDEIFSFRVALSIHQAEARRQSFERCRTKAYARLINPNDGQELARCEFTPDEMHGSVVELALLRGYPTGRDLIFEARGGAYAGDIRKYVMDHGIGVC